MCTFKTIHSIEHTNAKRFRKRILSDSIGVYFFFIGLGEVVWPNQGFHSFICHSPNTNLLFLKSMTCEHTNMVSLYRQSGGLPISLLTSSDVILLDSREAKGPKMSHRLWYQTKGLWHPKRVGVPKSKAPSTYGNLFQLLCVLGFSICCYLYRKRVLFSRFQSYKLHKVI